MYTKQTRTALCEDQRLILNKYKTKMPQKQIAQQLMNNRNALSINLTVGLFSKDFMTGNSKSARLFSGYFYLQCRYDCVGLNFKAKFTLLQTT